MDRLATAIVGIHWILLSVLFLLDRLIVPLLHAGTTIIAGPRA